MRKYDKQNKRNIGIIIAISVVIVIIFSYFIFKVISVSKVSYKVVSGSIFYDTDKNMVELNNDGVVKVKWSSKYYLIEEDNNYLLGDNSVIYSPSNGGIYLYGKFYEIKNDATVEIIDDETKLESSAISHFYKIADRKYLLVSSKIYTENSILNTSNYLLVDLDKLGNATLYNNEVNLKTFVETSIITGDYTFDVANEVLIYGDNKIDLKKIIGSTNEYSPDDLLVNETDDGTGINGGVSDNEETNIEGNTGGGNTGGGNTDNTTIYQPNGDNNGNNENNSTVDEIIDVSKRTSVIRIVPNITSISVDYVVYDPKDEYKNIYVEIVNEREKTSTTVYLNKNNTNMIISNLSPSTRYKLYFNYTYYEGSTLKNYNYNTIEVTTKVPTISLSLGNITNDSIDYVVSMDGKYNISSANIELLLGNEIVNTYLVNDIGSVDKFSGSIDVSKYDLSTGIVTIKLSNIVFEGNSYNTNVYYKFSY